MGKYNYFELIGLECDPPETNKRKIDKSIEAWRQQTEDLLANESSEVNRRILQEKLSLYEDIKEVLSSPKTRNPEAKACRENYITKLETLIEIMRHGQDGTAEVTLGQIRSVATKLHLQPDTVKEVYQNKGFAIQQANSGAVLKDAFLSNNISREIAKHIAVLRSISEPKYPWLQSVQNLYDLSCFISGGAESEKQNYRRRRTADLLSIMQKWATQYASDMSDSGHALADLFADGVTHVFASEENRRKYDNSLEKEQLESFFTLLRTAPEEFKHDRQFADSCIRTIQKHFPDYNMALALYNSEAKITGDPYEPYEALIHLTCANCGTPAEFRTREEAQKGKCLVCGSSLYIRCPSCGKIVPAGADRCACGFKISEMKFFEEYKNAAILALNNMDVAEAVTQLHNARNAFPGHPDLKKLSDDIEELERKFKAPIRRLEELIGLGGYAEAKRFLDEVTAKNPKLNLERFRVQIRDKIEAAARMMPRPGDLTPEAANRCVDILEIVKDYTPAKERLRMIRPRAPRSLRVTARSGGSMTYVLSWQAAGDRMVTYRVVRKTNEKPSTFADGEILCDNSAALEFTDQNVQSGILYGYAVFACREGACSDAAAELAVSYSEIDQEHLQINAGDGEIRFDWIPPENAMGVRILRKTNGIPDKAAGDGSVEAAARAQGSFTDRTVDNFESYGYRLQCIYRVKDRLVYSSGITTQLLRPQPKPRSVTGVNVKNAGTNVTVTWDNPDSIARTVEIRQTNNPVQAENCGQVLTLTQINSLIGNGAALTAVPSSARTASFTIPHDSSCVVAVITTAGSSGIIQGTYTVSSVEKCEIDRLGTRVEGNRLKIRLVKIPRGLYQIHYLMARKTNPAVVPWAKEEDARQAHMLRITAAEYAQKGLILINGVPQEDLYLSVIGEYRMPNGQTVYSQPSRLRVVNTPKVKIQYNILWGSGGLFSGKPARRGSRLIVQCQAAEIPRLCLVYRTDGHIPMNLNEPQVQPLCVVEETESGYPRGVMEVRIPDEAWSPVRGGSQVRLLAEEEAYLEYEVVPEDITKLTVPVK